MRAKVKGRGFTHAFQHENLAQPLDDATKIKAHNTEDWDSLIKGHMRLGCAIASRYVSFGGDSDEMVSAAMHGICFAVDRIKQGLLEHDNITGYIVHYIHNFCGEARRKDCLIPVPRGIERIHRHPITNNTAATDVELEELYEVLENITINDIEHDIVFLRQQGYTDTEVANELSVSVTFVLTARHELFERFKNVQRHCD